MVAGLKEESSSGWPDLSAGSTEVSKGGSNGPQSGPCIAWGERHKEIKRQKSSHERKARIVLELEERAGLGPTTSDEGEKCCEERLVSYRNFS
jgi:hypothetical protein